MRIGISGLSTGLERVGFWSVVACVLMATVSMGATRAGEFWTLAVLLPIGFTVCILGLVLRGDPIKWGGWIWPGVAFLAFVIWRTTQTELFEYAIEDCVLFLLYAMVAIIGFVCLKGRQRCDRLFGCLFAVAVAGCFLELKQTLGGDNTVLGMGRPAAYAGRGSGFFVNPNHWACFLEMVFMISIIISAVGKQGVVFRIFAGYTAAMALLGIVLSQSRMALLAVGITIFLLLIYLTFARNVSRWIPALFALAVVVAGVGSWTYSPKLRERVKMLVTEEGVIRDYRPEIWRSAICVWRQDPWLGAGPNQFRYKFRPCRSEWLMGNPVRVHSDYLNLLTDHGLVGAAIVLVFAAWSGGRAMLSLRAAGRNSSRGRRNESRFRNSQVAGVFAILVILIHAAADFPFFVPANGLLAALLIGLIVASPSMHAGEAEGANSSALNRVSMWALFIISLTVAVVHSILGLPRAHSGYVYAQAMSSTEYEDQLRGLERAYEIHPTGHRTMYSLAETYRGRSFMGMDDYEETGEAALRLHVKLSQFRPADPYPLIGTGMTLDWLGRGEEADSVFERAYELDPNNKNIVALQGWHAFQRERYADAVEWFERARRMPHDRSEVAASYLPLARARLKSASGAVR